MEESCPSRKIDSEPSLQLSRSSLRTNEKLVQVTKNENGASEISMARSPVNAINYQLLFDVREALLEAENNGSTGIILSSSMATVFSAGLDFMEMYKPEDRRCRRFWTMLQDTWLTLYSSAIPTAAAINGACPAGGCMLAMICEYRVMVDGAGAIGLNETQLGVVAPKWLMTTMVDIIGPRQAEIAILRGEMFTPREALKIGLVDDLANDKKQALSMCHEFIESYATIPASARNRSKQILRGDRIEQFKKNREEDCSTFLKSVKNPEVQTHLEMYVGSLKNRSKL